MEIKSETIKTIVNDVIEALKMSTSVVNELIPRLNELMETTLNQVYTSGAVVRTTSRMLYRESLLNYLDDLIQRGVTPDEALRFIGEHEVRRLEGRDLGDILSAVAGISANTLSNSNLTEILQQALTGMMVDGPPPVPPTPEDVDGADLGQIPVPPTPIKPVEEED
jgi:hypothetical protein